MGYHSNSVHELVESIGVLVMADSKPPKNKGGRPRGVKPPKRPSVSLKGSLEWRDWLNELGNHMNMPSTVVIDQALKMYAKANGFDKPFPGR